MDDSSKNNNNLDTKNLTKEKDSIGLEKFSYADFVILSSTLAFAISEELNDIDIDLLISFLAMVSSDLAMLRTQKGVRARLKASEKNSEDDVVDDVISEDISDDASVLDDTQELSVTRSKKRKQHIKKRRIRY